MIYAFKPESAANRQINGAQPMVPNMNLQDSLEQRIEQLMRSPAKQMLSVSMEARGEGYPKKFEMVNLMSHTHQQNAPLKKWNHQIVMMHNSGSPQQMCISSEMKMPIISQGAAGSQLTRQALPAELTSQVFHGQCQQSAHAMTFKAKAEMSPERKANVQTWSANPIYDRLNVEVENMKPVNPLVEKVIDFGHRFLVPSFEAPTQQGFSSKMASIQATRSLRNDRMTLRMQTPRSVSTRSNIKVPQMIDQIVPVLSQ